MLLFEYKRWGSRGVKKERKWNMYPAAAMTVLCGEKKKGGGKVSGIFAEGEKYVFWSDIDFERRRKIPEGINKGQH